MNGYGQGPQGQPQGQNPSGMPYPFGNQSMPMPTPTQGTPYPNHPGVYPPSTAPYPSQQTQYPVNSAPYPNHPTAPYPGQQTTPYPGQQTTPYPGQQTTPYPGQQTTPYPNQQAAPYPGQPPQTQSTPYANYPGAYSQQATSYPGQAMSQPLQQAYPPQASYQGHCGAAPNPMAQTPSFNPLYAEQPTSCQAAPFTKNTQIIVKLTPTVVHDSNFNPTKDAEVLRKAMKGFGTDEKAIISILSNRNNQDRQHIANSFKTLYGKDLVKDLKSEISGKFEDLIVAMMTPIVDYYVKEIHDSISGIGTNEDVLITILCTLRNQDIHQICSNYKNKYGKSLESDIRGDTSGNFERLMVSLCNGQRDESANTDISTARSDASRLRSAGVGCLGTDESEFNSILAQRNVHQLKLIFQEYSKLCGHDISTAIDREFSGHIKTALLTIVKCVKDSSSYFAEQLNDSMSGIGTKDQKLIFICVTRSEVDMENIKKAFHQKYGKTLEKRISEDTSGDYAKCLIELISLKPRSY